MTRLSRSHRLKRRSLIRPLFDRSRSDVERTSVGCVRILYRLVDSAALPGGVTVQTGFVVGRQVGTAVTRNRIRRLMREAYRHHGGPLLDVTGTRGLAVTALFVFRGGATDAERCVPTDIPELVNLVARRLAGRPGP